MRVFYSKFIEKTIIKGKLPKAVWVNFRDAFASICLTENFSLFDIKKMVEFCGHEYYRLRIGKYRALFWIFESEIHVEKILPRGEVYKK